MGCCSSAILNDSDKIKYTRTYKRYPVPTMEEGTGSKPSYSFQISNGSSSGVSSNCNSPTRQSTYSIPQSSQQKGRGAKTSNFTLVQKNVPTAFQMQPVCDDFGEAAQIKQQQQEKNKSFGYHSETNDSLRSTASTQRYSCLGRDQDIRLRLENLPLAVTQTPNELDMEMYMISRSQGLMPKTSSPILQRRDLHFYAVAPTSLPSHSYQKWAQYLQNTPTYLLHNITDIPEAIAGHFSPLYFPVYTDLEEMENAAKRFKLDTRLDNESEEEDTLFHQNPLPKPSSATHTMSTDL